jgi:cell division protein FtsW (lipid II flippase)
MPANSVAMGLLLLVISLLVLQPDFGQSMLIALVWGALFFMAGMRLIWVAGLFSAAAIGLTGAYSPFRTLRGASSAFSIRPQAIHSRSTTLWSPSCAAAGSAAGRARGP